MSPSRKSSPEGSYAVDPNGGTLVYNSRPNFGGALHDPTAILYVRNSDLDANGQLLANVPIEPLGLLAGRWCCVPRPAIASLSS